MEENQEVQVAETPVARDVYADMGLAGLNARIAELEAKLANGGGASQEPAKSGNGNGVAKNKVATKPQADRKYVLLDKVLGKMVEYPKVPKQQADLAEILSENLELETEYSEEQIFDLVAENAANYKSLADSVQHPSYLFRYYRGLAPSGKHAGFVAREFLRQIN